MKFIGSNVRFLALSATIPNLHDIAIWLGKNSSAPGVPCHKELFGEEFRPVKLQKFVYGYQATGNNFVFDKALNKVYVWWPSALNYIRIYARVRLT